MNFLIGSSIGGETKKRAYLGCSVQRYAAIARYAIDFDIQRGIRSAVQKGLLSSDQPQTVTIRPPEYVQSSCVGKNENPFCRFLISRRNDESSTPSTVALGYEDNEGL